jgi:hypothetical protein
MKQPTPVFLPASAQLISHTATHRVVKGGRVLLAENPLKTAAIVALGGCR